MRRHLLARVLLTTVLATVLATGCGVRPSGVITGGPAPTGGAFGRAPAPPPRAELYAALYFVTGSSLTPVFRPMRRHASPTQVLVLLQKGPTGAERAANLRTEVPAGLGPVTVTTDASGDVGVVVSADVTTLSTTAADQIVCTVGAALSTTAPITLTSATASRGPRTCPLTG